MLIAIEGVDLTGKSTLASLIQGEIEDTVVAHAGPPTAGPLASYEDPLFTYRPCDQHVVLDRWHVGEYVWPEVFRRQTHMVDVAVRRHVEMFMASRGCVIVYASRDFNRLHAALDEAEQEPLRPGSLGLALDRFEDALDAGMARGYVFGHDFESAPLSVADIRLFAQHAEDDVAPLHAVTSEWVGSPNPHTVIAYESAQDNVPAIPGRLDDGLEPMMAQALREIPESKWRGVAVLEMGAWQTDRQVQRFAELAGADRWISVGDGARNRVIDLVRPKAHVSVGFRVRRDAVDTWLAP